MIVQYHLVNLFDIIGDGRSYWPSQTLISSAKLVRPRLNSVVHLFTVANDRAKWRVLVNSVQLGFNLHRHIAFQMQEFNHGTIYDFFHFYKNTDIDWHKRLSNNNWASKMADIFTGIKYSFKAYTIVVPEWFWRITSSLQVEVQNFSDYPRIWTQKMYFLLEIYSRW